MQKVVLRPINWEKVVKDSRIQGFPAKESGIFDKRFSSNDFIKAIVSFRNSAVIL